MIANLNKYGSIAIPRDLLRRIMPEALPLMVLSTGGHYVFDRRANLAIACALFAKLDSTQFVTCCLESMRRRDNVDLTDKEEEHRSKVFEAVGAWLSEVAILGVADSLAHVWNLASLEEDARFSAYGEFLASDESVTSYHRIRHQVVELGLLPSAISQAREKCRDIYWIHIGGSGAQIIGHDDEAIKHCMTTLLVELNKSIIE